MRRLVELASIGLIWCAAVLCLFRFCVRPAQCNVIEKAVEARTYLIAGERVAVSVRLQVSRDNLSRLSMCCPDRTCGVNSLMLFAANYRLSNDQRLAISSYVTALRYDRRPELYLNLGEALIEAGQYDEGVRNLVTAAIYQPELASAVPAYYPEVMREVSLYRVRLEALKAAKGLK